MSFDNSWALNLENIVFSKIKARITSELGTKYPNINVTLDARNREDIKLPTVYVQFISLYEEGATIEGNCICGVSMTVQANVVVSKKQGFKVAKEVEGALLNAMKSMYFSTKMEQIEFDTDDILTSIIRFERVFGNGDKL